MRRIAVLSISVVVALAVTVGCASNASNPRKPAVAPISNTDPCATKLHDVSGAFLLYYRANNRLPNSLAELENLPGDEAIGNAACPASGKPYVYTATGIYMVERGQRVILYDATPAHSGYRWAITVLEPVPDEPLQTRVVALPESFFLLRR